MKITPYFELDGKRYEIKATRYLMAEYEKIGERSNLTDEDKVNAVKMQNMATNLRELALQLSELKDKYYADMTDKNAKAQYKACKEEYDEMFEELARYEVANGGTTKLQKETINSLEKIAVLGLAEQYYGYGKDGIFNDEDYEKGKELWCNFVDTISKDTATEWLVEMADSLFGADEEEENPFLAQKRAKNQERADNQKKGFRKIK